MTEQNTEEFNYGDIIEYIDSTRDLYFEAARKWARTHNATFEELIDRREERDSVLYRYWQILKRPEPEPYVPTPEEEAERQRQERIYGLRQSLKETDYVALKLAEVVAEKDEESLAQMLAEYADVLADRKAWREELSELLSEESGSDESGE